MARRAHSVVFLVLAAASCQGEPAQVPFDAGFHIDAGDFDSGCAKKCVAHVPGDPGVAFGSGEIEWDEVADGDPVSFWHGPQDGYHFNGSVKERNIDTSAESIVAYAVFDGGEQINDGLGVYARADEWFAIEDGWRARVGYYVIMNIEGPDEVDGHEVCVVLRLTDASGAEYMDERTISLAFAGDQ
ncbi:MAG: hypothetical protein L0206_22525 [Actinobacteria bacterium]|nr:hypothetical protein [Actinomycetota bacterium]